MPKTKWLHGGGGGGGRRKGKGRNAQLVLKIVLILLQDMQCVHQRTPTFRSSMMWFYSLSLKYGFYFATKVLFTLKH